MNIEIFHWILTNNGNILENPIENPIDSICFRMSIDPQGLYHVVTKNERWGVSDFSET